MEDSVIAADALIAMIHPSHQPSSCAI